MASMGAPAVLPDAVALLYILKLGLGLTKKNSSDYDGT